MRELAKRERTNQAVRQAMQQAQPARDGRACQACRVRPLSRASARDSGRTSLPQGVAREVKVLAEGRATRRQALCRADPLLKFAGEDLLHDNQITESELASEGS